MSGTAEKRYSELESFRDPFLKRGWDASKLTIPSLLPESRGTAAKFQTPFQGIGARGVNNLASKLLLTLLPPNSPFFRLMVDSFTLKKMTEDETMKTQIEKALGSVERAVMSEIETTGDRVQMFEALKHLIVVGNILLFIDKNQLKVFHLDKYVVKRDPMGNVLEIITKEFIAPNALPKRIRSFVEAKMKEQGDEKTCALYTRVKRKGDKFEVHQEVKGTIVPGSKGSYPVEKTPWLPLRYTKVDGEDYGHSFVEEYYGDLHSLEKLSKALVEGSAAAAKVLFLTDPNGTTRARTLARAPNGSIREGSMKDITVLQLDKYADFRVTLDTMIRIEDRLSHAFLLNSSIQRNGERVTAEEIRYMAQELEDALGGVYSILSLELQLPYVNRRMAVMQKGGRLPQLPKNVVRPSIVTGLEALGRGHDLNKLDSFLAGLAQTLGADAIATYINVSDYITRRGTAVGIDTEGLVKSEAQVMQERQQAMQQQMLQQLSPEMLKQIGGVAQKGMAINGKQQEGK